MKSILRFLNNTRVRSIGYQVILSIIAFSFFIFIINNASSNLVDQGIATGFGFLNDKTGFNIASSLIHYDSSSTYLRLFITALLNTLLVSFISIIFATIIGFFVGIMRLSGHPIASRIAATYVETLRNIPLLLQVFFWYFAILQPLPSPRSSIEFINNFYLNNRGLHFPSPELSGQSGWFFIVIIVSTITILYWYNKAKKYRIISGKNKKKSWWALHLSPLLFINISAYIISNTDLHWNFPVLTGFNFEGGAVITPEFFALFIALSTYTGAYIAENVSSGIQSVEKSQVEAGRALGLSPFNIMRFIIIPNAMRVIIPPLTNQYLSLTKNSSLAAAIAYPDIVLMFAGTALNQTGQAIEILLMIMLVYLLISLVIALLMNIYNKRFLLVEK
jgi:general L-amino acid transport system permease protein